MFTLYIICLLPVLIHTKDLESKIIGILWKPCIDELPDIECKYMLEARYVRWIEQSGGRVVPIPFDSDHASLDILLNKIGGVFFPGGGVRLVKEHIYTEYYNTTRYIFGQVKSINEKGGYFPIWGTCLGFQILGLVVAEDTGILTWCGSICEDYATYLQFVGDSATTSSLFSMFSPTQIYDLAHNNVTYNNHGGMMTEDSFYTNPNLPSFYNVLSYSYSYGNKYKYISAMQAKSYPFYGIQFHPEYLNYDFNMHKNIPRGIQSLRISQIFSNFLLQQSIYNVTSFNYPEFEEKYNINNYATIYHPIRQLCYIL